MPKGVYFSHRQMVLHTMTGIAMLAASPTRQLPQRRRLHADHPDVPRARLGHPVHGDHARAKQVYPGRYAPACCSN